MISDHHIVLKMKSYISCIKIRGTPILPPLMTNDLRAEMNYYKQRALAVEEKLSNLRVASEAEAIKYADDLIQEEHEINVEKAPEMNSPDLPSDRSTIVDNLSRKESFGIKTTSESIDGWKAASDDETITKSTDINRYMNISDSSKTDVTETISEAGKPRVPKTLDIVPITVDTRPNKSNSSSEGEGSEEEAPKLVRQGSYTLETPSPMLLAHLEHSREDYVPTPTINGTKRPEWNIAQANAHWESQQTKERDFMQQNYSKKDGSHPQARRNSISGSGSSRRDSNSSRKKNGHQVARSVDCIQSMLSKESYHDYKNIRSVKRCKCSSGIKDSGQQNYKSNKNISILNMANKLGGSLSTLNNQNSPTNIKKSHRDNNRMTKSFEASTIDHYECERSPEKFKPVLTSEKLIYVFKEIQKTHEQQMADLMARQQKEQIIMQQEFEKQQLMLLSQIEKSFPGVSLSLLAKKITETTRDDKIQGRKDSSRNSVSLPKSTEPNESRNSSSPLNGSSLESEGSISMNFNELTRGQSLPECKLTRERRKSSISRELFPLESNTTHVPITNGSIYEKHHIQAATIINAYARGYLVRRLMKTECVITLKNTYREALHCMLKLHVDAPLELPELNFHQRLQHQCDAASISIVELFAQNPAKRTKIIANDRQIKRARQERPSSARSSFSFATQRTLARKKFKEMGIIHMPDTARSSCSARTRCQTWTSNTREKRSPGIIYQGIKRSTSAGAVRKPWR